MTKLVVRDGKIKKIPSILQQARTKVLLVACAYCPAPGGEPPVMKEVLEDAVTEYRAAVREDEKGQIIT